MLVIVPLFWPDLARFWNRVTNASRARDYVWGRADERPPPAHRSHRPSVPAGRGARYRPNGGPAGRRPEHGRRRPGGRGGGEGATRTTSSRARRRREGLPRDRVARRQAARRPVTAVGHGAHGSSSVRRSGVARPRAAIACCELLLQQICRWLETQSLVGSCFRRCWNSCCLLRIRSEDCCSEVQ